MSQFMIMYSDRVSLW